MQNNLLIARSTVINKDIDNERCKFCYMLSKVGSQSHVKVDSYVKYGIAPYFLEHSVNGTQIFSSFA